MSLTNSTILGSKGGGGKGGGGGGGGSYTNKPDTLRSNDSFEILLGLGSGQWKGLVNGLRSLYINDVPLENVDGTTNFQDITVAFADGDPLQTQLVNFKLGGGGGITSVNTPVNNDNGVGTPGLWISGATSTPGADFVDIRLIVQQLVHTEPDGAFETFATIELEMRPTGSATWVNPLEYHPVPITYDPTNGSYTVIEPTTNAEYRIYHPRSFAQQNMEFMPFRAEEGSLHGSTITLGDYNWAGYDTVSAGKWKITGKTTSPSVKELRIGVPNVGVYANKTWEVRLRLVEPDHQYINEGDDDQEEIIRNIVFETITAVTKQVFGSAEEWRGLAWMQIGGKASDQLNGFPSLRGIFDTKIVKVPGSAVFDPITRQYTATLWNGTYVREYTNDPAWCLMELIEDTVSGIAAISPGATLNKWDALEASKYCSQLVKAGRTLYTNDGTTTDGLTGIRATLSNVSGKLRVTNSASYGGGQKILITEAGKVYTITYTATAGTGGAQLLIGSTSDTYDLYNDSAIGGTRTAQFTATGTSTYVQFRVNSATVGHYAEFDNITIDETQPRFSMNLRLESSLDADEAVKYVAGGFNALCVDTGDGKWRLKMDKPENPVAVFTEDNIIGGFQYTHTDMDTRFNDITLNFLNEETNYQEDRVRVYDQTNINLFGRKSTSVVAVGASSRQEAIRRGVLRLRTSLNETKIVKFTTNRQGKLYAPLQTILVADQSLGYTIPAGAGALADADTTDNRTTSRVISMNGARTELTLGRTIRLEPTVTYKIKLTVPNPNYNPDTSSQPTNVDWTLPTIAIERTLTNTTGQLGDVTVLYLNSALPSDVPVNAPIAIEAVGLRSLPTQFRIIEVTPSDGEEVSISAMIIDTGKYAAADTASSSEIAAWQQTGATGELTGPTVPVGGMFTYETVSTNGQIQKILTVDWVKPTSLFIDGYMVERRINGTTWTTVNPLTNLTTYQVTDPAPGSYEFRITAKDRMGRWSPPLVGTYLISGTIGSGPVPKTYGLLANRPISGTVLNELYVAIDQFPVVTFRWTGSAWVVESKAGAKIGEDIYDASDPSPTDPVDRDKIVTSLGTAAAITGQGAYATQSTLAGIGADPNRIFAENLIDMGAWIPASPMSGTQSGAKPLANYATTPANVTLVHDIGPSLINEVVVNALVDNNVGASAQGGMNALVDAAHGFNHTKTYRMMAWLRKKDYTAVADGYAWFGPPTPVSGVNQVQLVDGGYADNPYFGVGGGQIFTSYPTIGKWYLAVGIVHGSGYSGGNSGVTGVYDPTTGLKVESGVDYKWSTSATYGGFRIFQYFGTPTKSMQFARPVMQELHVGSVSLPQIMATVGADINTNVIDTNSGSPVSVPRSDIKTSLGTAAAIVGQAATATNSSFAVLTGPVPGPGGNEITDPTFATKWTLSAGVVRAAANATGGYALGAMSHYAELSPDTATIRSALGEKIPVTAGLRYYFAAKVQRGTTLGSGSRLKLGGKWLGSDGTTLIANAVEPAQIAPGDLTAGALPKEYQWSDIAPATAYFYQPNFYTPALASSSGTFRIEDPRVSKLGATYSVDGTTAHTVNYQSDGITAEAGQLPKSIVYNLTINGIAQTAGVVWTYLVVSGTINGFTSASGSQSMTGSGSGTFTLSSLGSSPATVKIIGTSAGVSETLILTLTKFVAAGSSGGGSTLPQSKASGWTSFNTTSFVSIGTITGTMPSGKTTANITGTLYVYPDQGTSGSWPVEMKVQRDISGVWTDTGGAVDTDTSTLTGPDGEGYYDSTPAVITISESSTSLTAGNTYTWRIVARITSGSRAQFPSGTITITAP